MDEYEIEDSVKFTPSCNSREEEENFINSQDFFITQECGNEQEMYLELEDREKECIALEEKEHIVLNEVEADINLESDDDDSNKLEDKNKIFKFKKACIVESNENDLEEENAEDYVNKSSEDNRSEEERNEKSEEEERNVKSDEEERNVKSDEEERNVKSEEEEGNENSDEERNEKSEEERNEKSEEDNETDLDISDSSSEEIIPVRRSKMAKSTPRKKAVKRTKIILNKKKKEIDSSCDIKNNMKENDNITKTNKESKNDKKKADMDSPSTGSAERENKYNLNSNELKIFNFFYNINRPVSGTELSLNFKGQITSTALQGICTSLESKSLLIIKVYSKSKIYMVNPNVFDMDKSEEYKMELINKIKLNEELKKKYLDLNTELRSLKSMDTEEEIDEKIRSIKYMIEEIEGRINMRENGLLVTKKEVEDYEKNMKKINKIYKERSKIVHEILGMLCENMNIKKKELVEEMELDL